MYEDKTLICKECGKEFVFTAGEQEFYASKGFENEPQVPFEPKSDRPVYCSECFARMKEER